MHIKSLERSRAQLRQEDKQITGLDLTKYLKNYACNRRKVRYDS